MGGVACCFGALSSPTEWASARAHDCATPDIRTVLAERSVQIL